VTSDAFESYGVPAILGHGILPDDGKPEATPVMLTIWHGFELRPGNSSCMTQRWICQNSPARQCRERLGGARYE